MQCVSRNVENKWFDEGLKEYSADSLVLIMNVFNRNYIFKNEFYLNLFNLQFFSFHCKIQNDVV